ncbi:MAG: chromate transporter [Clostridia bacterium]|nr:chromate transporter [Clostridia bacterium]
MKKEQRSRLADIFTTFLKFGCFTFGGGWSIVAQIQKEYVEKKHWITDEELLDFTSVGRSLPGLMIGNASVLFGHHTAGIPGALLALLGIVLPPFVIMIGVTFVYGLVKDNPYVANAMMGVRAAVVPIIISAMLKLFKAGMKDLFCYLIALGALALCLFTNISNVLIVVLGAAAGLIYMEVKERHAVS